MRFIARKFQVHVTDVESATLPRSSALSLPGMFPARLAKVKRHFDSYSHHTGRMEYPEIHGSNMSQ